MNAMMAREIAAQAEVLARIRGDLAARADGLARPRGRVLAGGCGDSLFAPRALAGVFRRIGRPVEAQSAMDLAAFTDFRRDDTVVLSSISGGTKRTVEAARVARDAGAHVVALTCNAPSALTEASHESLLLPFSPLSRKTPHTLDYAVTLLALAEIARSFAGRQADETMAAVEAIPALLEQARSDAASFAAVLHREGKVMILGAGPDLGTAEYGAAKFHEAGGLMAFAAETENFVHGMNFMLAERDLLIVLGSRGPGRRRGQEVVGAMAPLVARAALYPSAEAPDEASSWKTAFSDVLLQTFFLQALCLQAADRFGLKLEEPRAGAADGEPHLEAQSRAMAG